MSLHFNDADAYAVPVYDGRTKFHLSTYWDRPYEGDVERDSTVMVLFTIRKGDLSKQMKKAKNVPEKVKFAIYLNLLGIIVLEDPASDFSRESLPGEPVDFGVSEILKFEQPSDDAVADDAGVDIDDDEEAVDVVL